MVMSSYLKPNHTAMSQKPKLSIQEAIIALKEVNQSLQKLAPDCKGNPAYLKLLNTLDELLHRLRRQRQQWEKVHQLERLDPLSVLAFNTTGEVDNNLICFLKSRYRYQEINHLNRWSLQQIAGPYDLLIGIFNRPDVEEMEYLTKIRSTLAEYTPVMVFAKEFSGLTHKIGARFSIFSILSVYILARDVERYISSLLRQKSEIEISYAIRLFQPSQRRSSSKVGLLMELDKLIEAQINDLTIPSLCRDLNYSRSHLSRKVKKLSGMKLTEYINQHKLQKSLYLLVQTEWSVGRIADSTGFSSQQYFTQLFSNKFGLSPSKYRKKWK